MTEHPKQYIYHYEDGECYAVTTIMWDGACADVVQVHQEYFDKCTATRLAEIVDMSNIVNTLLKLQGVSKVVTGSSKWDKKMGKYWRLLGFTDVYELDGVTYSYKEL